MTLMPLLSRLQKVETRNLQMARTGERLMISNGYNRHNARSPVPARKIYFLQTTHLIVAHPIPGASGGTGLDID